MSPRRTSATAIAVAALVAFAHPGQAAPWGLAPGEFYSELSGSFFSSRSFYRNVDEARTDMAARFEERSLRSHNEFGWKKRATVWVDLPFVSRSFVSDAGGAAASSGLGDIGLGVRVALASGRFPAAIELGWTGSLGTNRFLFPGTSGSGGLDASSLEAQRAGVLDDSSTFFSSGLQSLSLGLELGGALTGRGYWTLGGGYRTRYLSLGARKDTSRFADFVTVSAGLGAWLGSRLLVSGEWRSERQLSEGVTYDLILPAVPGANGPELQSMSHLTGPRVTFRVDERMDVFAGSWHTPGGRNVLHHDLYYCGIAWKNSSLDRLAGALGGTKAR
jgi:hypothetical protein